ncbi:nuclear transport factor 2 [Ricinus communis]|uniref:Ras-GTPase-activating protein-binding protein, putative n=1 Tax=Ricinus communis TaxID=3988 RepID=B9SKM6_RICCO|nr:nuclear transport factor 2 [Ricinus communis]EEF35823.1 Ras-GTPase-activating protein-binding protein, putative [Ricinus communis]|eukprot:XP_002526545.1 putative G3BP-like protein [Ricinus communis]
MGSPYPGPVSAVQVGSYFVGQYYQVLQQHPDLVHQFYADGSSMIRVDGDSTDSASSMLQIHTLVMSLNFTAIEIKTINSLESWNGGVMVMVSGSVKNKDFSGRRKFVQSFFLAPQEKGYFVLNDIFQFIDEEIIYQQHQTPISSENVYQQHSAPISSEDIHDTQLNSSSTLPEPPVSDYVLEEEAREYVNSVHIEDDPVDKYSLPEQQQQQDFETEIVVEEAPVEETPASFQGAVTIVQDPTPTAAALEEPTEEAPKKTWASILRVSKGPSSVVTQPPVNKSPPATSDWNHIQESTSQQPDSGLSYVPESGFETTDNLGVDEGEPKSVYVRNLPSDITAAEIEEEFRNFGRIKPDGVFIRNRKDVIGVCYAFVEFEDLTSVQNAIQASPIQLAGRQVYIEERRPNSGIASRGGGRGGRGRGRGGYQADAPRGRFGSRSSSGRGTNQDAGDYTRARGNGFYQRTTR